MFNGLRFWGMSHRYRTELAKTEGMMQKSPVLVAISTLEGLCMNFFHATSSVSVDAMGARRYSLWLMA